MSTRQVYITTALIARKPVKELYPTYTLLCCHKGWELWVEGYDRRTGPYRTLMAAEYSKGAHGMILDVEGAVIFDSLSPCRPPSVDYHRV